MITQEEHVMQLSARNQIPARVTSITTGEAIANVHLDANGVSLVASITVEAVRQLGLTEGSEVTAVIKASDVILATGARSPDRPRGRAPPSVRQKFQIFRTGRGVTVPSPATPADAAWQVASPGARR